MSAGEESDLTKDGQANDCAHGSASSVNDAPIGPGKVWRCDHCGLTWTDQGRDILTDLLPHLSPRPDAEVRADELREAIEELDGYGLSRSARDSDYWEGWDDSNQKARDVLAARIAQTMTGDVTPAPAPVDDREALVSAWDEGRAFGDPYQRRGVPDPADNPYRAGYVKGGR